MSFCDIVIFMWYIDKDYRLNFRNEEFPIQDVDSILAGPFTLEWEAQLWIIWNNG